MVGLASTNSIAPADARRMAPPKTTAPEKLKHLSAQPAIEPQPSVVLGQGLPWGQQSSIGMVSMAPCDMAVTALAAIGSAATEKATNATRTARTLLMVQLLLTWTSLSQVTVSLEAPVGCQPHKSWL